MFAVTDNPIDTAALRADLQRPDAGAFVVFEGWVRNHHRGRPVTRLDYEAFVEMAQSEGDALLSEIEGEFPGVCITCVHRTGDLAPGDIAVWIGATSAHRDDAFRAARLAIEEVKRRLPVWKKEYHPGAEPVWVNCTGDTGVTNDAPAYYARQTSLTEVGDAGQRRLAQASVLVVGVGGLGCPAALYLAGAGVGRLTLVDGGNVEFTNLHRQILFEAGDVGAPKVARAALALRARNPHIAVQAINSDLIASNLRTLLTGHSVVLDCTDNFTTRLLLHDACLEAGVPLVQAAVHQWEGVINVFERGAGGCLYCIGQPRDAAALDRVGTCAGAPVFGPAVGTLGLLQATEAIKVLLGRGPDEVANHHTLLVDLLSVGITRIARPARPNCPQCARIQKTNTTSASAEMPPAFDNESTSLWVSSDQADLIVTHRLIVLVNDTERSAREWPSDVAFAHPDDTAHLNHLVQTSDRPVALACVRGILSATIARGLRAAGHARVFAVEGGLPRFVGRIRHQLQENAHE